MDIYLISQDYQEDFIIVVKEELSKRKIPLDSLEQIKSKAEEISDKNLELGEQGNPLWIAFSFVAALFGGFIGLVAGYIYAFSKKKNSQGEAIYAYNEQTRKYGTWILIVGVIVFVITVYFNFEGHF